jgi:hypothetical protein
VFTARYALSPYIKQTRFVFKGLIGTGGLSRGWGSRVVKLTTHLHLLLRLRTSGARPLLPLYASTARITSSFCLLLNLYLITFYVKRPVIIVCEAVLLHNRRPNRVIKYTARYSYIKFSSLRCNWYDFPVACPGIWDVTLYKQDLPRAALTGSCTVNSLHDRNKCFRGTVLLGL